MYGVEVTTSGLEFEGDWEDICDFSEELEMVMKLYLEDKDEIEEYDDWRPREEDTEKDVKEKTAEEAAVKEKDIEKDFEGAKEELGEAEEKLADSVHDVLNGIDPSHDMKEALLKIEKVVGVESVRSIRKVEEIIYKKLMLKFNPYYFDTEDFSVNLERKKDHHYVLTINVTDEELREHFQESFC